MASSPRYPLGRISTYLIIPASAWKFVERASFVIGSVYLTGPSSKSYSSSKTPYPGSVHSKVSNRSTNLFPFSMQALYVSMFAIMGEFEGVLLFWNLLSTMRFRLNSIRLVYTSLHLQAPSSNLSLTLTHH